MPCYKVTLNWYDELVVFYTKTTRPDIAARNAVYKLAQKLGRDLSFVRPYFNHGDRILVTRVKEEKQ
uniref:Uncharacterized protein n=1 Tax=viral metagenome TaxID=1070528 RepID=A0A6M3LRM1_9ZZZZ